MAGLTPLRLQLEESRLVPLLREVDVYRARAHTRALLAATKLNRYAATEIETAVSELCHNVLHHAGSGHAWLRRSETAFEICCEDRGPGFDATRGRPPHGLGVGLQGAERLMGSLTIDSGPEGARVVARRALATPADPAAAGLPHLAVSVALRPATGEERCGDTYVAAARDGVALCGVVDGLGHGEGAARAAEAVRDFAGERVAWPLRELLAGAHAHARATRGAVAGFVRLAAGRGSAAVIGNVRIYDAQNGVLVAPQAGCLGVEWPGVAEVALGRRPLASGLLALLASDGVAEALRPGPPFTSSRRLVEGLIARSDTRDDALAMAIRLGPVDPLGG
ncbi:MAG TPA: ATP-binding protein [Limnochordia bacterium]|nr:ATP-binding protein [Limnochordia bacterium]